MMGGIRIQVPLALALGLGLQPSWAETVVPTRTIRANSTIALSDLKVTSGSIPGMVSDPNQAAGLEARAILYAGRPIRPGDLGPPAVIERNQLVVLAYRLGGLNIETEGRALDRAGVGDRVRVINLSSRNTVSGVVDLNGTVRVGE